MEKEDIPNDIQVGFGHDHPISEAKDIESALPQPHQSTLHIRHLFQALNVSPDQGQLFHLFNTHPNILVSGLPGTGKTYTLANLATTLLYNQQKVVIIAEVEETLSKIQEYLHEIGIKDLSLLIANDSYDFNKVIQQFKQINLSPNNPQEDPVDWEVLLNQNQRNEQHLQIGLHQLDHLVFGSKRWIEVVSHFLSFQKIEQRELLNSELNPKQFQFNLLEFERISQDIQDGESLYKKVNRLDHPLQILHPNLFQTFDLDQAQNQLDKHLPILQKEAAALYHEAIALNQSYATDLKNLYETHFESCLLKAQNLKEEIQDYDLQYGTEFSGNTAYKQTKLRIKSIFQKRQKNIIQAQNAIKKSYTELVKEHKSHRFIPFIFENEDSNQIDEMVLNINRFIDALNDWKVRIPNHVQTIIENNSTQFSPPNYKSKINIFEEEYSQLIQKINTAHIIEIEEKEKGLQEKQIHLKQLLHQLEIVDSNRGAFQDLYPWNKFWLACSEPTKLVFQALIQVHSNHWIAAFKSWYLHHVLDTRYRKEIPHDENLLKSFETQLATQNSQIASQVKNDFNHSRAFYINQLKQNNKTRYQQLFGNQSSAFVAESTLKELATKDFNFIHQCFPILLLSPECATKLLPKDLETPNVLLIDNLEKIEQKSLENNLGKFSNIIAFGNLDKKNPPTSFQHFHQISLIINHQSPTPFALFARDKAWKDQLVYYPLSKENTQVRVYQVDGNYSSENEDNPKEIEAILIAIHKLPANSKLGILCFSEGQLKAANKALNIYKKSLENKGIEYQLCLPKDLMRFNFSTLFISFTFDSKTQGLHPNLLRLNQEDNIQHLQYLSFYPAQKITVFSSIEVDYLYQQINQLENQQGLQLLADYLFIAHKERNLFSKNMTPFLSFENSQPLRNEMVMEIVHRLKEKLEPTRIKVFPKLADLCFDIYIEPKDNLSQPILIQVDDFLDQFKHAPYWNSYIKKVLKETGYHYITTWSVDWWKHPKDTCKQLIQKINIING